jgi:LmbE family N-acetylglucosaminyl deacetylase
MTLTRRLGSFVLLACLFAAALVPPLRAQAPPPQDSGATGLAQMLTRLRTTARLLHTTAHPDDDDGPMLVYETRSQGTVGAMLQLNRGEGGQNKVGSELFDELGLLRTLELLQADRYYGVQQRFTRVVDFGYSKSAEETFAKWGGHDAALGDMVRVIRTFRPDVIVSRFNGTPRDGHGHHQAAGILSREAFRAAADPNRFPEQIREGLLPWQVKKLYTANVRADEDYTLRLDVGDYSPLLGMSFAQFSVEGLGFQISQGVGGFYVAPGHAYRYYKLLDSSLPPPAGQENSFFDGIDTTLPGLAARLGGEESQAPFLRPALVAIDRTVQDATAAFSVSDPSRSAPSLLSGLQQVRDLIRQIEAAPLSPAAKSDLLTNLHTKERQFERAANLALATELDVAVDPAIPTRPFFSFYRQEQTMLYAVPGQTFTVTARLYDRGNQAITPRDIELLAPPGWQITKLNSDLLPLHSNDSASVQFRVTVPADAAYTRPYWRREDTQTQNVYTIDDPRYLTLPLPPPPLRARATYALGSSEGEIRGVVQVKYVDPTYGQSQRPLAVAPPLAVDLEPPAQVVSTRSTAPVEVTVGVHNNLTGPAKGTLRLEAPAGWQVEPASQPADFAAEAEYKNFQFTVRPAALREGKYEFKATLEYEGKPYSEGYHVIGRHDIGYFYFYLPAQQKVSTVDVALPRGLKVGYIMGAGDDIPAVLKQLGVNVEIIAPAELASGNLSRFDSIVLGIRGYDVRNDVREYNPRLLEFVKNGGTLLVQYNSSRSVFNQGHYTPYPATLSRDRVTVEEAPVTILDPASAVFHSPNAIGARDFDGWVQERGLYFMSQWDDHFQPLLSCADPGDSPQKGGLLYARYGKGVYLYTGYAFFRQLPAGVPGAIRLFVNLLSAGQTGSP